MSRNEPCTCATTKCREESFKFFQLVAIGTEGGGAAHTINLCKQCCNERRLKQGEQPVKAARWREMMEQTAFRGKLWKACVLENSTCTTSHTTSTEHKHSQPRNARAGAVVSSSSCLDESITQVGPGQHPQYTRAW